MDDTLRAAIDERWLSPWRGTLPRNRPARDQRGELRPSLDPDVVIDALYGPLYHRLLLPYGGTEVRIGDAYIEALVDAAFGGLETFTKI